jgi:hypothetical protein
LLLFRKKIVINHNDHSEIIHSDEEEELEHLVTSDEEDDLSEVDDEEEDTDEYTDEWVDVPDPRHLPHDLDPDESASRSKQPIGASARRAYSYRTARRPAHPYAPSTSRSRSQSAHHPYPEVLGPPSANPSGRRPANARAKSTAPSTMSRDEDDYPYPPHVPHPMSRDYPYHSGSSSNWGRGYGSGGDSYTEQFPGPFDDYDHRRRGNRASMGGPPGRGQELMLMQQHYAYPGGFPYYPHPQYRGDSRKSTPTPPAADDKHIQRLTVIEELLASQKQMAEQQLKAEKEAALKAEDDKIKALAEMITKATLEQAKRDERLEKARKEEELQRKQAELATLEAKKVADEKAKEVKVAAELAKLEAEKAAAKKAAEEKEKWDKEMADLKKKHDEAEEAKKKLDEEVKKLRPTDDMKQPPIRFKDAVGRKFSFPWHICKTWKVSISIHYF